MRKNVDLFGENMPDKAAPARKKANTKIPKRIPAEQRNRPRKRGKPRKKYCWWAFPLSLFSLLVIGACVLLEMLEYSAYQDFLHMKESVYKQTFYNGVVVESYDVSGHTLEEMLTYWDTRIETPLREKGILFTLQDSSFFVSAQELGYESNYEAVLKQAWSEGREGTLEQRYRTVRILNASNSRYEVTRVLYDKDKLRTITDSIAEAYTVSAVDAAVAGFDFETCTFSFTESSSGTYVDADALFEEACTLLDAEGGTVTVEPETVLPSVTKEDLEGHFGMITQAVTSASSSTSARLSNIKLATAAINGTVVESGGTFSFNDTVGQRTKKKGYKVATVYSAGEISEDVGGGVCQVSTTLWNAAMKANCEIVERHAHSRPVAYVDKGKDATVSWTSQDMKFLNTSDYPIYIVGYVTNKAKLYFEIYGYLPENWSYIKIEPVLTQKIDPGKATYEYSEAMPSGQQEVVTEARTGYKVTTYRVYYAADDTVLDKQVLCKSYYKEAAAKIVYG